MGQRASDTVTIDRPAADVMAVIIDLEKYPEWAEGIEKVEIVSRDEAGRPLQAKYWVDAKVFQLTYTLEYQYVSDEHLTWHLTEGDQISQLDGVYRLNESEGSTRVDYQLEADLSLPLPGFMKKRGAKVIMETGLRGLKKRVEQVA